MPMSSLYQIVYTFFAEIMSTQTDLSAATELVAIVVTLLLTYYVILYPLRLVLRFIFRRKNL